MRLPRPVAQAVARIKPLVPDAVWPVLVTGRSLLGQRPLVAAPSLKRLLVLSAHPDDETIGCGGLLALSARAGTAMRLVVATSGEATRGSPDPLEEVGRRRVAELRDACQILGVPEPVLLGLPDGHLAEHVEVLATHLAHHVHDFRPDAIALPWLLDGHDDHRAVVDALRRAAVPPSTELWGFETWTPLPPNRLVDITAVLDVKERAVAAHRTAHLAFDAGAMLGLNRYRGAYGGLVHGSAEAFLVAPAATWFGLADG
jgi:LmbE family N-acetylglucosaminyl deacetylase